MMYDKKYQVFISSTYTDLIKAREEAIKVILNLYQIPIGMEMFSADNDEQWSTIQSTIDNSDYYLLILGHRYGSTTKEGVSYTEKEFDYAKSIGIPIISFVKDRNIATTPNERDSDFEKQKALDGFYNKVTNNSMCDFWSNENELGQKIAIALPKIFFKTPRIGWAKSNLSASIETTEEMTRLFQENRELREELESYKVLSQNETPSFEITLNDDVQIILKYEEVKHRKFNKINIDTIPNHLLEYISENDIDIFNKSLSDKEQFIKEFIKEDNFYQNVKNNSVPLNISVSNIGSIKANDVYVDIVFPKEIILMEKNDVKDLESPIEPKIESNPLDEALMRHNNPLHGFSNTLFNGKFNNVSGTAKVISSLMSPNIMRAIPIDKNYLIDKEKNTVTLKIPKLTHTRTFNFKDKILIASLEKGTFDFEINIICDELNSPITYTKKIVVE